MSSSDEVIVGSRPSGPSRRARPVAFGGRRRPTRSSRSLPDGVSRDPRASSSSSPPHPTRDRQRSEQEEHGSSNLEGHGCLIPPRSPVRRRADVHVDDDLPGREQGRLRHPNVFHADCSVELAHVVEELRELVEASGERENHGNLRVELLPLLPAAARRDEWSRPLSSATRFRS